MKTDQLLPVPLAFAALSLCASAMRFPPRRADVFAESLPQAEASTSAWRSTYDARCCQSNTSRVRYQG